MLPTTTAQFESCAQTHQKKIHASAPVKNGSKGASMPNIIQFLDQPISSLVGIVIWIQEKKKCIWAPGPSPVSSNNRKNQTQTSQKRRWGERFSAHVMLIPAPVKFQGLEATKVASTGYAALVLSPCPSFAVVGVGCEKEKKKKEKKRQDPTSLSLRRQRRRELITPIFFFCLHPIQTPSNRPFS